MEMLERVARVLCEHQARGAMAKDWTKSLAVTPLEDRVRAAVDRYWPGFVDAAHGAIAAMREPTPAMIAQAVVQTDVSPAQIALGEQAIRLLPTLTIERQRDGWIAAAEVVRDWQALIDAALEPSSPAAGR